VGNSIVLGERGGEEQHTLTVAEVPAHNHPINGSTAIANAFPPAANLLAQTATGINIYKQNPTKIDSPLDSRTITPFGGSLPHENRSPFLVMNWCIALTGIFPSRN
jgi:microcystin-dependent protein